MSSRREFLKLLGGAVGGVALATGGPGRRLWAGGGGSQLPNGYEFHRLISVGDSLPGGATARFLPASVKINNNNEIIFHAGDNEGRQENGLNMGVYELTMDYSGSTPVVADSRKVVREGDTLNDGRKVAAVGLADTNRHGSCAVKLRTSTEQTESLYLERNKAGLERVMGYNTATPDNQGVFGATLGNFDLYDSDDVLLSSYWVQTGQENILEGLFHLSNGEVSNQGKVLLQTGDLVPDCNGVIINKFGLIQGSSGTADYVVQVHTETLSAAGRPPAEWQGSAVITGSTAASGPDSLTLAAASPNLSPLGGSGAPVALGDVYYGPRIGSNGEVASVVHPTDSKMQVHYNGQLLASTGDISPTGRNMYNFGGPVVGNDGLVYFVAYSDYRKLIYYSAESGTEELLVANGTELRTLLTTGTKPCGESGPTLVTIALGLAKEQVDQAGRMVFIGEFDDQTMSIMLGIPV